MGEKAKLEVLEIQMLLGYKEGVDQDKVTPGFSFRLCDHIEEFMKKEGVPMLTIHQRFCKDEDYHGASRNFQVHRCDKKEY